LLGFSNCWPPGIIDLAQSAVAASNGKRQSPSSRQCKDSRQTVRNTSRELGKGQTLTLRQSMLAMPLAVRAAEQSGFTTYSLHIHYIIGRYGTGIAKQPVVETPTSYKTDILIAHFAVQEIAVSRNILGSIAAVTLLSAAMAFPLTACADVLEISGAQSTWIAGGPRDFQILPLAVEPLAGDEAPETATFSSGQTVAPDPTFAPSLTEVADTAGPAEWRVRVAELAAKYDISPTLLEAVVWQESRWRSGAVSPVGARGLTQLMPGTAREMGVDSAIPTDNLEGGARYLRIQLDSFGGDVEKALAAYNAGPGRVKRAGGIPRITETQQYVAAIMSRLAEPVRR
jgi:soluble lytic murein transglycosylase-like protein